MSVNASSVQDGNQNFGAAGCGVQADWYASSNWPLTWNEWNLWGAGTAVALQDLTGKGAGWHTFGLANLSNIPTGAGAYAGLKWSVPCDPSTQSGSAITNEFSFYSFDSTLTIRNVPATVVRSLKALARRRRRSMEQEVRELLEVYVSERCSVLNQIEAAWGRQTRRATADEVEAWITAGRH